MEENKSKLFTAMVKANLEFPAIEKTKTANAGSYNYKYADLSDIMDAIRKPLADNGLCISQYTAVDANGKTNLVTAVLHSSGEMISSSLPLRTDQTPQQLGSQLTYYRRYSISAILGIVADSDDDGKAASTNQPKPQQKSAPPKQSEPPKQKTAAATAQQTGAYKIDFGGAKYEGKTLAQVVPTDLTKMADYVFDKLSDYKPGTPDRAKRDRFLKEVSEFEALLASQNAQAQSKN